ncbi:BTB domain-containing protein, partial [Trichostrongylus colubriformis]
ESEDVSTHHVTDIVCLNVGGKRYTTHFETLVLSKSSYFQRFVRIDDFSGKVLLFRRNFSTDSMGAIFVNRDGDLFAHALQFMRDGKRTALPQNTEILRQLVRESEFFGMDIWKSVLEQQLEEADKRENQVTRFSDKTVDKNKTYITNVDLRPIRAAHSATPPDFGLKF